MRAEHYERWVWGLCALAYVYVFPYQLTLNNPNENVRFYMTAALVESHSYAIDQQRERWGWVNDAAVHGGHVYSVKAPGTSFLGVPGYALYLGVNQLLGRELDRTSALWVCRVTATIVPTLLGAWWFMVFLRRRNYALSLRLCTTVAVWLGSLLYGYGMLFVSHTLSAVVAFAAFVFVHEVERGERTATPLAAAWFGLLAAATTWLEYPGLVASCVLLGYALFALRSWQLRLAWLCGSLPLALLMMHFQYRAFGSPFTPGHLFVESAAFRAAHEQGLYGAVGVSPAALYGLLLDPGAGLFPLTPLLWFALPGLWLQLRDRNLRATAITCGALSVLSCLAISAMNNWRGGWTIGPRYLAVCVPFLAFPALHTLDRLGQRAPLWAAGLGLGTAASSLVASGIPSAYYPHLPPELTRPLPQLFSVLIAHDFAPPNLGNWLGIWGTASLVPLYACALAALGLCALAAVSGRSSKLRALAAVSAIALLSAGLCLIPLYVRPRVEPGVSKAVSFVTNRFQPSGHDRAARLRAQLTAAGPNADPSLWKALEQTYQTEGREHEAKLAAKHRLSKAQ
jgi:hypothetical protein